MAAKTIRIDIYDEQEALSFREEDAFGIIGAVIISKREDLGCTSYKVVIPEGFEDKYKTKILSKYKTAKLVDLSDWDY